MGEQSQPHPAPPAPRAALVWKAQKAQKSSLPVPDPPNTLPATPGTFSGTFPVFSWPNPARRVLSPCRVSRTEPPESSPHPNPISVSDLPQTIPREVVYPFSLHYSPSAVNHNPLTLLSPPSPVTRAVVPTGSFSCLFTQPPVGGRNKRKPPSKKKKSTKGKEKNSPKKSPVWKRSPAGTSHTHRPYS